MVFVKRLVQLDVDSTFIQQEAIELLAAKANVLAQVSAITDSAMRGDLDFEQSLRARVLLLKGLPESVIVQVQKEISLTDGAEELVKTLHAGGLIGAIIDRSAKAVALKEFATASGVAIENTVAIGDGANDLDMMVTAGLSIAFNAKPVVVEAADLAINEPSLRSVIDLINLQ